MIISWQIYICTLQYWFY